MFLKSVKKASLTNGYRKQSHNIPFVLTSLNRHLNEFVRKRIQSVNVFYTFTSFLFRGKFAYTFENLCYIRAIQFNTSTLFIYLSYSMVVVCYRLFRLKAMKESNENMTVTINKCFFIFPRRSQTLNRFG